MNSGPGSRDYGRNQLPSIPPEIPRRPDITISRLETSASTTVAPALPSRTAALSVNGPVAAVRHDRVREIHKNAWLKRIHPSYDKRGALLTKRTEKWWVVFCVHDDVEAYLEFYSEPKMAQVHKPVARVSLLPCLHVSPSIIGQDNEFQFAVTLATQVIFLVAADWDQMLEWVESLQGKLREMNILSPKDNVYSKLPETKSCSSNTGFGATRDPNSPLPPTPHRNLFSSNRVPTAGITDLNRRFPLLGMDSPPTTVIPNGTTQASAGAAGPTSIYLHPSLPVANVPSSREDSNGSGSATSVLRINVNADVSSAAPSILEHVSTEADISSIVIGNNNSTLVHIGFQNQFDDDFSMGSSSICTTSSGCIQKYETSIAPQLHIRKVDSNQSIADHEHSNSNPLFSSLPASITNPFTSSTNTSAGVSTTAAITTTSDGFYDPIFTTAADTEVTTSLSITDTQSVDMSSLASTSQEVHLPSPPSLPKRCAKSAKPSRRQPQGVSEICPIIPHSSRLPTTEQNNGNHAAGNSITTYNESHSQSQVFSNQVTTVSFPTQDEPLEGMIGRGNYPLCRAETRVQGNGVHTNSAQKILTQTPVSLKESQVMRLNLEINHPSGVRISLRKKDCVDTIAFIDYLGAVWIAGWKQQEHPVLYYAFHVGDQVLSLAGQKIQTSEEARKTIKSAATQQVEFIIKRLPHGKVFVLKRKVEGEALGLVAVGNCSEITEVIPNSIAANAGLLPKATSVDRQLACNWVLTEINNRPLSLLARESEVRDRLNAVGKEISILVQPADLVKHMKKQLKALRSFKEYLVV